MKVLYLYSELLGYNMPIFERLVSHYGATVDVIHWSRKKLTPFVPSEHTNSTQITFYDRSSFTSQQMVELALSLKPDLVYVTGWMDRGYFPVLKKLKAQGVPIVAGLDSQWTGSLRQQIGALLIRWLYKRLFYSYVWVPGPLQYEYAARIGFKKTEILSNLLSGNTKLFSQAAASLAAEKSHNYPKTFLYVGRFAKQKGIDLLLAAYDIYKKTYQGTWGLTCIGNGPMQPDLEAAAANDQQIHIVAFLPQPELVKRAQAAGAFVLPSRYEPWGVVAHEFSAAGLPLIFSEYVGARQQFLIDGLNGYTFYNESAQDLAYKMHLLSSKPNEQLLQMGLTSTQLAQRTTPEITAASLMSVLSAKLPGPAQS
jgi:glycosyltransferase involved in cell wall biosynthesis